MGYLKNKNILITGASQGLGALIAMELSREDSNLILVSSSTDKLKKIIKKCGNKKSNHFFKADFQKKIEIIAMTNFVKKKFKKIDIIFHIAGGGLKIKSHMPDYEDYIKVFNLNLFSIFEINRELIPFMVKKKSGTIFHVGSVASKKSSGSIAYNVSKHALSSYVRTLAHYLAKDNICVTGINPGGFECKGNAMDRLKKTNIKAYKNYIKKKVLTKYMPQASELIPIIKTLIVEKNMIFTGSLINCDSGEGNM